ncbi:MAG TPA: WD40 repeat domain-containing protein [Elainellaceae cyanobacterium]
MQRSHQPRAYDAVLGGKSIAPKSGAVLGGLDGVRHRLASDVVEHRIAALQHLQTYGDAALELIIQALSDRSLDVQKVAFTLLRSHPSPDAQSAISHYDAYQLFECLDTLTGHAGGVTAVAISPNGQLAASAGRDATLRIWDLNYREERFTIPEPSFIYAMAIQPDDRTITAKTSMQTIKAWDLKTENSIDPDDVRSRTISSVTISGNHHQTHKHLISGSQNTVRIWNLHIGKEVRVLRGHTSLVTAVAANPDHRLIISGSEDRTVRIWGI